MQEVQETHFLSEDHPLLKSCAEIILKNEMQPIDFLILIKKKKTRPLKRTLYTW